MLQFQSFFYAPVPNHSGQLVALSSVSYGTHSESVCWFVLYMCMCLHGLCLYNLLAKTTTLSVHLVPVYLNCPAVLVLLQLMPIQSVSQSVVGAHMTFTVVLLEFVYKGSYVTFIFTMDSQPTSVFQFTVFSLQRSRKLLGY